MLEETLVSSVGLGRNRAVWVGSPEGHGPRKLCVIIDGENYLCNVELGVILTRTEASGDIWPMTFLFVPVVTPENRHYDYTLNAGFTRFLVEDLMVCARGVSHRCNKADTPS